MLRKSRRGHHVVVDGEFDGAIRVRSAVAEMHGGDARALHRECEGEGKDEVEGEGESE